MQADGLLTSQNRDGGWPYRRDGRSWTEPTAYALLALHAEPSAVPAVGRGIAWLRATQRSDGGWPPQAHIAQSTWVTAVVALLGPGKLGSHAYSRAVEWLIRQTGEDASLVMRMRQLLVGQPLTFPGWPWFPSTTAWVTPTALSMLALRQAPYYANSPPVRARLDMGASYLLAHTCSDGGWNYGAARALDYDARSYPETTGVALLALSGSDSPKIRHACHCAQMHLSDCRSSEADSWLRLGLLAHGRLPADILPAALTARTIVDMALARLASVASQGHNPFLKT